MKRASAAMSGSGKKSKKGKSKSKGKPVHKMHIRHTKNGGYIAEHEYAPDESTGAQPPSDEYHVGSPEELGEHVMANMPPQGGEPDSDEPPAAAAPAAPAPQPQPGA